jgi:DNA-binding response OmpR family regulator
MALPNSEPKKVLLVCAPECTRIEDRLLHAGCLVTKVAHGTAAVESIKHGAINAVILISTGSEMDLTETALNLRDVNASAEIIILADRETAEEKVREANTIAHVIPKTKVLTMSQLDDYLKSARWQANPSAR